MSFKNLVLLTLCASGVSAASAAITVTSYNYLSFPNSPYSDSGSERINGIDAYTVWSPTSDPSDISQLVGWQNSNPSVNFQFASATIQSFEVWAADSNGARCVSLTNTITVRTSDSSFSETFNVVDPSGAGQTVRLLFSGFSVNTDQLIVESTDTASQWTMFTEVGFFGTVPEPSTSLLALLSGLFLTRRRRS